MVDLRITNIGKIHPNNPEFISFVLPWTLFKRCLTVQRFTLKQQLDSFF